MKRFWLIMTLVALVVGLALVVAIQQLSKTDERVTENRDLIAAIENEGVARRDQTCVFFERDAMQAVDDARKARKSLRQLKRYISNLPPNERTTTLNKLIVRTLPQRQAEMKQAQKDAKTTKAPPYCDEPGVGLAEPRARDR